MKSGWGWGGRQADKVDSLAGEQTDRHAGGEAVRKTKINSLPLELTVLGTLVRSSNHLSYPGAVTRKISTVNTCIILRYSVVCILKVFRSIRDVCFDYQQ